MAFTGARLEEALRLTTVNPAAMTGLEDEAGSLAAGTAANLIALDAAGRLTGSVIAGQPLPMNR